MQECLCAPVTALEMANVSVLLDMAGTHDLFGVYSRKPLPPAFVKVHERAF